MTRPVGEQAVAFGNWGSAERLSHNRKTSDSSHCCNYREKVGKQREVEKGLGVISMLLHLLIGFLPICLTCIPNSDSRLALESTLVLI